MKKYIFLLLIATPAALAAQQKFDTVILKNGKSFSGYIYKMDDGKIYLSTPADSVVYTANEVQTIMFCHSSRGDCNTVAAATTTAIFKCNQCSTEGNLKINGGTNDNKITSNYTFNGERFTQQKENLVPGNYSWSYSDSNKKEVAGKFTIQKGEVKEIVLFENK